MRVGRHGRGVRDLCGNSATACGQRNSAEGHGTAGGGISNHLGGPVKEVVGFDAGTNGCELRGHGWDAVTGAGFGTNGVEIGQSGFGTRG